MNCIDCTESADVIVEDIGFCCEHYARRAALMRRNADHLGREGQILSQGAKMFEERAARR